MNPNLKVSSCLFLQFPRLLQQTHAVQARVSVTQVAAQRLPTKTSQSISISRPMDTQSKKNPIRAISPGDVVILNAIYSRALKG